MIPVWKVRRELLRIWRQLTFLPLHPVEQAWFRFHPRLFPSARNSRDGAQAHSDAVAVFLIHQPGGMEDTVVTTCRHLGAAGYAVHLVSNAPLRPDDVQALTPYCSRIIQRPNHGYDFGGYRQAILELLQADSFPSRLLLLNDSIWFPVVRNCDLLHRLEALGTDLAGPVHYDHRSAHRAHLQSYMILFSARALRSDVFRSFWAGYAMSNNKVRTIRNGEMRLTHVFRQAGLTVSALRSAYEAPDLASLSPCERAAVQTYDRRRFADRSAPEAPTPRPGYILTNHPLVNLRLFRLPLLKKDRAIQYRHQRAELLTPEAAELRAGMEPAVLEEIRRRDTAG